MEQQIGMGEMFAVRRLKRLPDETGYETGQHKARAFSPDEVWLSWVDNQNKVVVVRAVRAANNAWIPIAPLLRADVQTAVLVYTIPVGFTLSKSMVAALDDAVDERFGDEIDDEDDEEDDD